MTVRIGSLFSGIGGFELGLERAIPGAVTVWQCEQNKFCQKVLKKHWPGAKIYNDVRNINETVEPVDILCGGFPCQDISIAGKQRGIQHGTRSGLWWEMHRIVRELQPRIIIMENVAAILSVGGRTVLGSLADIGYDCEWTIISANQCGAPHIRKRWFGVAYPNSIGCRTSSHTQREHQHFIHSQGDTKKGFQQWSEWQPGAGKNCDANAYTNGKRSKEQPIWSQSMGQKRQSECGSSKDGGARKTKGNYWETFPTKSPLCRRNDGVPNRLDRIRALGNAIVPQCSEWVGRQIVQSGLLDDLLGGEE